MSNSREIIENISIIDIDNVQGKSMALDDVVYVNLESVNPVTEYKNKNIIYVDISCVENGTGKIDFSNNIKGNEAPSRARRIAKVKDIIISTVRPNLKGFAFIEKLPSGISTIFSTGFAILAIKDTNVVIPQYLYLVFMNSLNLMSQMAQVMEKSSYPSINSDNIKSFVITIPDIKVQERIINEYDTLSEVSIGLEHLNGLASKKTEDIVQQIWGEEE